MATIQNNPLTEGLSGMFGGLFVFKNIRGKTIVTRRPKPPSTESARQRQTRVKFKDAARFAKEAMEDAAKKAYYQRKAKKLGLPNAYTAAVTDYMRKGELHTQIEDTGQGTIVVAYVSKKGFNGGRITAQHVDTNGSTISAIRPLQAYTEMRKFSLPRNGSLCAHGDRRYRPDLHSDDT